MPITSFQCQCEDMVNSAKKASSSTISSGPGSLRKVRTSTTDKQQVITKTSFKKMANLCSAYVGKKIKKYTTSKEVTKKSQEMEEATRAFSLGSFEAVRNNPLYSSLRVDRQRHRAPKTDSREVTVKPERPRPSSLPRTPVEQRSEVKLRHQPSWATSDQIMDVFCQPQQRELYQSFRETSRRPPPQPSTSQTRYPRSHGELDHCLSQANKRLPANIPVIVADQHTPKTTVEVEVEQGTIVNSLYKSGKWVFVKTPEDKSGYIPIDCVRPIGEQSRNRVETTDPDVEHPRRRNEVTKVTKPRKHKNSCRSLADSSISVSECSHTDSSLSADNSTVLATDTSFADSAFSESCSFLSARSNTSKTRGSRNSLRKGVYFSPKKSLNDLYRNYCTSCEPETKSHFLTVVFDYTALNYDDVSVCAQDVVTSSDDDDSDWVWVRKANGQKGYIPRACTVDLGLLNLDPHTRTTYL